jgi:restriction endonuclease S subunit
VPEGWEVVKVRQHFRLRVEKVSEKDFAPLSVAKIGVVAQLADVAISMAEGDSRKLVREGDFVVNSRSDRKGSCGIAPRDGSVTTISIVLEPHDIERKFVHYLFRSIPWVEEFYRNGRGIVADLWTTRWQEMRNMWFPRPPLPEQRQIVAHIEEKTAKIDALVEKLGEEIERLKEYRERLVADAVTGARRV